MKKFILSLSLIFLTLFTYGQVNYCDSIEISVTNSTCLSVNYVQLGTNISNLNISGIIGYDWTLTDFNFNWVGWDSIANPNFYITPNTPFFNDTILVCLTVIIYDSSFNMISNCYNNCADTLVWDGTIWTEIGSVTTSTEATKHNKLTDNRIYDVLGRELLYIPTETMYIQNRQKYIKLK